MLKFACSEKELSCIIGHLFAEVKPPCVTCADDSGLTISGTTHTGDVATLTIRKDGGYYDGNPRDVQQIREKRCMNGP